MSLTDFSCSAKSYHSTTSSASQYSVPCEQNASSALRRTISLHPSRPGPRCRPLDRASVTSYLVPSIAPARGAVVSGARNFSFHTGSRIALTGHHAPLAAAYGTVVVNTPQREDKVDAGAGTTKTISRDHVSGATHALPVELSTMAGDANVIGWERCATMVHTSPVTPSAVPSKVVVTVSKTLAPIARASPTSQPVLLGDVNMTAHKDSSSVRHASPASCTAGQNDTKIAGKTRSPVIRRASPASYPVVPNDTKIASKTHSPVRKHASPEAQPALLSDANMTTKGSSTTAGHISPATQSALLSGTDNSAKKIPAVIGHLSPMGIHLQSIPVVPRRVAPGERSSSILQPTYCLRQDVPTRSTPRFASVPASLRRIGWDDAVTIESMPASASVSSVDSKAHWSTNDTFPPRPHALLASTSASSTPRRPADGFMPPLAAEVRRASRSPKSQTVAVHGSCDPDKYACPQEEGKQHTRPARSQEHAEDQNAAYVPGPPLLSAPPRPVAMGRNPLPTDPRPLTFSAFHHAGEEFQTWEDAPVMLHESAVSTRAVHAISPRGVKNTPTVTPESAVIKETVQLYTGTRHSLYDPAEQESVQHARGPAQNDSGCASFRAGHQARLPPRDSAAPGKAPNMLARSRPSEESSVRSPITHKDRFAALSYDLAPRSVPSHPRRGNRAITTSPVRRQHKTPLTSPRAQPPDTTMGRAGIGHVWPLLSIPASIACPQGGSRLDLKCEPARSNAASKVDIATSPLRVGRDTALPLSHMVPLVSPGTQQSLPSLSPIGVDKVTAASKSTTSFLPEHLLAQTSCSLLNTSPVGTPRIATHAAPVVASTMQFANPSTTRTAGGDRARSPSHGRNARSALLQAPICGMEMNARATSSSPIRDEATRSSSKSTRARLASPTTQPLDDQRECTQKHVVRHRQPACCPKVPTAHNHLCLRGGSDTIRRNDPDGKHNATSPAKSAPRTAVVQEDLHQSTRPLVSGVRHPAHDSSLSQSLGGTPHVAKTTSPYGQRYAPQEDIAKLASRVQSTVSDVCGTTDDSAAKPAVLPNSAQPRCHPKALQEMHSIAASKNTYDSAPTPSTVAPSLFALHTPTRSSTVQARSVSPPEQSSGGVLRSGPSRFLSPNLVNKSTTACATTRGHEPSCSNDAAETSAGNLLRARSHSPSTDRRGNSQHRHAYVVGAPQEQGSPDESHAHAPVQSCGFGGNNTYTPYDMLRKHDSPGFATEKSSTSHPFFETGTAIPRLKSATDSGKRVTIVLHDRAKADTGWVDVATVPTLHYAGAVGRPTDERPTIGSALSGHRAEDIMERQKQLSAARETRESPVSPLKCSLETHANSMPPMPRAGVRREQQSTDASAATRRSSPRGYPVLGSAVQREHSFMESGIGQRHNVSAPQATAMPSAQSRTRVAWCTDASESRSNPVNAQADTGADANRMLSSPENAGKDATRLRSIPQNVSNDVNRTHIFPQKAGKDASVINSSPENVGKDASVISSSPENVGNGASKTRSATVDTTTSTAKTGLEQSSQATTLIIQQQRKEIESFLKDMRHSENTESTQATGSDATSTSGLCHESLLQRVDELSAMCDTIQTKSAEWGNAMEITHQLISETSL